MYHLGKVIAVYSPRDKNIISADSNTQATLWMWDENVITLSVASKISNFVRKGDLVLADYSIKPGKIPSPKQLVIKILKGKDAEEAWNQYTKYNYRRKEKSQHEHQKQQVAPEEKLQGASYIR